MEQTDLYSSSQTEVNSLSMEQCCERGYSLGSFCSAINNFTLVQTQLFKQGCLKCSNFLRMNVKNETARPLFWSILCSKLANHVTQPNLHFFLFSSANHVHHYISKHFLHCTRERRCCLMQWSAINRSLLKTGLMNHRWSCPTFSLVFPTAGSLWIGRGSYGPHGDGVC